MTRKEAIEYGKKQLEIFGGDHRKFIEIAIKELEKAEEYAEFKKKDARSYGKRRCFQNIG